MIIGSVATLNTTKKYLHATLQTKAINHPYPGNRLKTPVSRIGLFLEVLVASRKLCNTHPQ